MGTNKKCRVREEPLWLFDILDTLILSIAYIILHKLAGSVIAKAVLLTDLIISLLSSLPYIRYPKNNKNEETKNIKTKNRVESISYFLFIPVVIASFFVNIPIWIILTGITILHITRLVLYKITKNDFWFFWIAALVLDVIAFFLNF